MSSSTSIQIRCDGPGTNSTGIRCGATIAKSYGYLADPVMGTRLLRIDCGWARVGDLDLCPACQRIRYGRAG